VMTRNMTPTWPKSILDWTESHSCKKNKVNCETIRFEIYRILHPDRGYSRSSGLKLAAKKNAKELLCKLRFGRIQLAAFFEEPRNDGGQSKGGIASSV